MQPERRSEPGGKKSGVPPRRWRSLGVGLLCLLIVSSVVYLALRVSGLQSELERAGRWLDDADALRALLEDVATEAERRRTEAPRPFLAQVPDGLTTELGTQRLILDLPLEGDSAGVHTDELLRTTVPVRTALEWLADGRVSPEVLARPARDLSASLDRAMSTVGVQVRSQARSLGSSKTWFLLATFGVLLGAAYLALLARGLRRQRDVLASDHVNSQRYRLMFGWNHAVMLLLAPEDGRIIEANQAACRFYGVPVDELKRRSLGRF